MIKLQETIVVDGFNPTSGELIRGKNFSDPASAIEYWFKLSKDNPMQIAITPSNESEAMNILNYANDHKDKIKSWHSKYNCPYKLDYMLNSINRQVSRGSSNISHFPDQLDPFSLG